VILRLYAQKDHYEFPQETKRKKINIKNSRMHQFEDIQQHTQLNQTLQLLHDHKTEMLFRIEKTYKVRRQNNDTAVTSL